MNLEDIVLSEINQTQKDKYYMIPLILQYSCLENPMDGGAW